MSAHIVPAATPSPTVSGSGHRDGGPGALRPDHRARAPKIAASLTIVGLATALVGLLATDPTEIGDLGLITVVPTFGLVGFGLLAIAPLVTIFSRTFDERVAAFGVASYVTAISAAPSIVYDTARYAWTFKHVGIVDYIDRTRGFSQTIEVLPIYHNWPGFFAGSASLTEWLGLENAIVVAQWAPLFLNLMTLLSLVLLVGQFTASRQTVWLAALLFFVTNWIGQDYFSPQAISYILYLTVMGLAMRFYRPYSPIRPNLAVHLITALLIFTVVASHQLTPMVMLVALGGLVVWRRTAVVWVPLAAGIVSMVFWLGSWARGFVEQNLSDELSGVGSPVANAAETLAKAAERNDAQELVALAGRALIVGIALLAIVGLALRVWRGENYRAPLVLLGAPGIMMVLEFGGEILFRVALFMLPMWCLLGAEALRSLRPRALQGLASAAVVSVCLVAFAITYYGKDSFYSFSSSQVAVVAELMQTAPPGSLLVEGNRNYPAQFVDYEKFIYVPIDSEPVETQLRLANDPTDELYEWLSNERYPASYLLLTDSQHIEAEALGTLPPNFIVDVETALRADARFEVVIDSGDAVVFVARTP